MEENKVIGDEIAASPESVDGSFESAATLDGGEGGEPPKKDINDLKLNYPKTLKVGLGFAVVMVFWTAYNFVMPLLLEQAFGFSNVIRNIIVGIGSVLSIFLLPVFGKLSDKTRTKWGKRTPFIVIGSLVTVIAMIILPFTVNGQLNQSNATREGYAPIFATEDAGVIVDKETGKTREVLMGEWWDAAVGGDFTHVERSTVKYMETYLETHKEELAVKYGAGITAKTLFMKLYNVELEVEKEGGFLGLGAKETAWFVTEYTLNADGNWVGEKVAIDKATYGELEEIGNLYTKYASFGVKSYVGDIVNANIQTVSLVFFILVLLIILVAQTVIRTPAVSLMPDVTPSPIRSQGNAMINLIGGVGGAVAFLIYTIGFMLDETAAYMAIFLSMAIAIFIIVVLYVLLVKEPKMLADYEVQCKEYGLQTKEDAEKAQKDLPKLNMLQQYGKEKMGSFFLILASIFMWFMGYSGISTNLSVYCVKVLDLSAGLASIVSGASMLVAAIGFIPVGYLAGKIGRRKSIILGFILAVISFFLVGLFVRPGNNPMIIFTLCYLISGFGLIFANVNTLPMVLELASPNDIGKFTGYYYVATMSAQALGPILGGVFMDNINPYSLFYYSAACVVIAALLMVFVKHGESPQFAGKPAKKAVVAAE